MYPNSIDFDLKVGPFQVFGGQGIYYLGAWTPMDSAKKKP